MANPAVTYSTFPAASTADGTQVSQNFTDVVNSLTDGTKTLTISALTAATMTITGTLTVPTINSGSSVSLVLKSNGTTGITLDTSQNSTFAGSVTANSTTDSFSAITGSIIAAGGLGVAKTSWFGGDIHMTGNNGVVTTAGATASQLGTTAYFDATGTPRTNIPGAAYTFTVTAANATAGASYTNNGQTFWVVSTITGGVTLLGSATGAPAGSGTLTKASGTGDATITFSSAVTSTTNGGTATFTLPSSGGDYWGYITNAGSGKLARFAISGNVLNLEYDPSSNWSSSANTASKDCLTYSAGVLTVQHNSNNATTGFRMFVMRMD